MTDEKFSTLRAAHLRIDFLVQRIAAWNDTPAPPQLEGGDASLDPFASPGLLTTAAAWSTMKAASLKALNAELAKARAAFSKL